MTIIITNDYKLVLLKRIRRGTRRPRWHWVCKLDQMTLVLDSASAARLFRG